MEGEADHAPSPLHQEQKNLRYTINCSGLERSDRNKEMIHRFPCQDACASNRWISCSLPGTAATYIRSSISEKVADGLRNCGYVETLEDTDFCSRNATD